MKAYISQILRKLKIIEIVDIIRFYIHKIILSGKNKKFVRNNPEFKLPPDYLLYEAFRLDYQKYHDSGYEAAIWLKTLFEKYIDLKNVKILDWGCGPARIIRHLPNVFPAGCQFYATDYNENTILWCKENIQGINFNKNEIDAYLPYPDDYFDGIYGLSIFTHLSENKHKEWAIELLRILKPKGIFIFSTQGKIYRAKLTKNERILFDKGQLVVRASKIEGHRVFSAFHPPEYIRCIFREVEILEHIEPKPTNENLFPQDIWIIRK